MLDPSLRMHQSIGISLYTLLAAVVVLGVLGSVIVTQFDGNRTRSRAGWELLQTYTQSIHRFHLDTGCWPSNNGPLIDYSLVGGNTSCAQPISPERWHGPYIKLTNGHLGSNTRYDVPVDGISPGAVINTDRDYVLMYYAAENVIAGVVDQCRESAPVSQCKSVGFANQNGTERAGYRMQYVFR